jgi:hypothetical protein
MRLRLLGCEELLPKEQDERRGPIIKARREMSILEMNRPEPGDARFVLDCLVMSYRVVKPKN